MVLHLLLHPSQRHQGQRLHSTGDVRLQTGEWAVYKLVSIPDNVRLLTGENGVYTLVSIPDDVLYKLVNMEFIRW